MILNEISALLLIKLNAVISDIPQIDTIIDHSFFYGQRRRMELSYFRLVCTILAINLYIDCRKFKRRKNKKMFLKI